MLGGLLSWDTALVPLIFALLVVITCRFYANLSNLPPGPWGFPVIGYLPFLDANVPAEEQFHKLSLKYGNIFSLKLGSYLTVVLDDFQTIKEAYVKQGDVFSGRPEGILLRVEKDDPGVLVSDGNSWKEHRRFAISTFRDYGMGKFTLEARIVEEIHFLLAEVAKQNGKAFEIRHALGMSVANNISTLEFGKRFDLGNKKLSHLFQLIEDLITEYEGVHPRKLFTWLLKIPYVHHITGQIRAVNIQKQIQIYLKEIIEDHKQKHDENEMNDYIDAFLTERNAIIKKTGGEGYFGWDNLRLNLQNMFVAATETTVSALRWALLVLMIHPEIQEKLHQELDQVLGMDRAPSMADRPFMKYMEAFLCELQRYASIAPLSLVHTNLEETTLCGYRIPKRTNIFTNLWAINYDPKLWEKPEKFMPERFINEKGQIEKPEYFIPFGIGKRSCLGESLAKMELFLYLTSILQRFTILPPEGKTPKLEIDSKIVRRPKPYNLRAVERPGYQVQY